jgi:hypothetical protein
MWPVELCASFWALGAGERMHRAQIVNTHAAARLCFEPSACMMLSTTWVCAVGVLLLSSNVTPQIDQQLHLPPHHGSKYIAG